MSLALHPAVVRAAEAPWRRARSSPASTSSAASPRLTRGLSHSARAAARDAVVVTASGGGGGGAKAAYAESEMELTPPASREDSFAQAQEAIAAVLAARAKKSSKQRKSTGRAVAQLRVAVELPLASESPAAVAAMVRGACGAGGGAVGTAVFGDAACAAAMAAGGGGMEAVSLEDALAGRVAFHYHRRTVVT